MLRFGQVETGLKPVCTLGHIAKKTCPQKNGDLVRFATPHFHEDISVDEIFAVVRFMDL